MDGEPLTPLGMGRFRVGNRPDPLPFPPKAGVLQEAHILAPGGTIVLSRTVPPSYSAAELRAYEGEYRSDELDATYTVVVMPEGGLSVLRDKVDPVHLTAVTVDTFSGPSLGSTVTFVRATSGDVTGLTIAANTPRRLSLTRVALTSPTGK